MRWRADCAMKQNYETVEGADDLSVEYANADVAICAFGVTAYELAACGVPAIYIGLTRDHVLSASAFADAGMGLSGPGGQNLRRRYRALPARLMNKPAPGAKCANRAWRCWTDRARRALPRSWHWQ